MKFVDACHHHFIRKPLFYSCFLSYVSEFFLKSSKLHKCNYTHLCWVSVWIIWKSLQTAALLCMWQMTFYSTLSKCIGIFPHCTCESRIKSMFIFNLNNKPELLIVVTVRMKYTASLVKFLKQLKQKAEVLNNVFINNIEHQRKTLYRVLITDEIRSVLLNGLRTRDINN